jgi:phage tail sheath protein FI
MPSTFKTPGVYIEEISKFPPSVAQVETAVPAFIGYTASAIKNGEDLTNKPTRITSLLEYESYFGTGLPQATGNMDVFVDKDNNYAVTSITLNVQFYMYDSLRLFFDNGGGKCYIVSVGNYSGKITNGTINAGNAGELNNGLAQLETYDEPTIILFPDAVSLAEADFYALQQAAIAQSAKLQDRVAVLDLQENRSTDLPGARDKFRDKIGINDLKYGMAYTPWLNNSFARVIDYSFFKASVKGSAAPHDPVTLNTLTADPAVNALVTNMDTASQDGTRLTASANALLTGSFKTLKDQYVSLKNTVLTGADANAAANFDALVSFVRSIGLIFPSWRKAGSSQVTGSKLVSDLDNAAKDAGTGLRKFAIDLIKFENNADVNALVASPFDYTSYNGVPVAAPNSWLGIDTTDGAFPTNTTDYGATGTDAEKKAAAITTFTDLDAIFNGLNAFINKINSSASQYQQMAQDVLYSSHPVITNIVSSIQRKLSAIPPSGGVVGIYAKVDNDRGVWKAPANVSLSSVVGPTVFITNDLQDDLNVDVNAGKSINAIRAFTGKGTIIWGARTLAGNDNEWRYVPVRRFYNMVEESVKKASSQFVFEPNDANTWVKVKAMIENYLTILWRQGALAGAKPEQAFFVKIGLGETMTAIDILEGRMNVEIGMAAVRPAEFIILKFSHKMQES